MRYPGGKSGSGVVQRIISQMPPHQVYIEPFLGSGAVLFAKLPALINVGVDADPRAVDVARARLAASGDSGSRYEFEVGDGISYLRNWRWWAAALVYCDPPYLMATRISQRRIYRHELDEPGHIALLDVLVQLPCMVVVSGYESELYARRLSAWRVVRYRTMTRGGRMADEWLWCNFPEPDELHDYRFLGRDYRERERIHRKLARWRAALRKLPVLERKALVSAMEEAGVEEIGARIRFAGRTRAGSG